MPNAIDIAELFIKLAKEKGEGLTQMKLQKLLYFANGWNLGVREKPIFDDSIEAWKYGPVLPCIYHIVKHFKSAPIPSVGGDPDKIDDESKEIINAVWRGYGKFDALQLSSLTHQEGTPWAKVAEKYGGGGSIPTNKKVDNDEIQAFFKKEYERGQAKRRQQQGA